jgi:beta-galactosidase/beta-glucuronidase
MAELRENGSSHNIIRMGLQGFRSKLYKQKKLRGFSPQANYTDRATAACRRS